MGLGARTSQLLLTRPLHQGSPGGSSTLEPTSDPFNRRKTVHISYIDISCHTSSRFFSLYRNFHEDNGLHFSATFVIYRNKVESREFAVYSASGSPFLQLETLGDSSLICGARLGEIIS